MRIPGEQGGACGLCSKACLTRRPGEYHTPWDPFLDAFLDGLHCLFDDVVYVLDFFSMLMEVLRVVSTDASNL